MQRVCKMCIKIKSWAQHFSLKSDANCRLSEVDLRLAWIFIVLIIILNLFLLKYFFLTAANEALIFRASITRRNFLH